MSITTDQRGATGSLTSIDGVDHYRIDGVERMEPFLMTVVSDSDLWMFLSTSGALTAGRKDADDALFPYETDDRLHRASGITGPVTVIARTGDRGREVWRPFDRECPVSCSRSIAKSTLGNRVVFDERNEAWGLTFRAVWEPSDRYGWVRTLELVDDAGDGASLEVLDGLLDIMPPGVEVALELSRSNLVDAYKRSETGPWGTAAVYSLESLVSDRTEPGEALNAAIVWSAGFPAATVHLDERSVAAMVAGRAHDPENLLTGRRGCYLLQGDVTLPPRGNATWVIVADTGLGHPAVLQRVRDAAEPAVRDRVAADVAAGSTRLRDLLAGADAFQTTADPVADAHHLSNVLFNCMRGGVFPYGYRLPVDDFLAFLATRNRPVHLRQREAVAALGEWTDLTALRDLAGRAGDPHLERLALEYLPLTFARRHGDPSRPWNRFTIRVREADGSEVLSYEGNWRDIFQNWEALLASYPGYFGNVIAKFLNASTVDGHNPYRIARDGIDWEVPDPDDPWSHIGYWGDHQIVYLLRLLEAWARYEPAALAEWLARTVFVYADVPYVLAGHEATVADPRNTIVYDVDRAEEIGRREALAGTDGRLVVGPDGLPVRVGMFEKLLVPALAKLSVFVPGGGIWLTTQRPEWNDANNALAGYGLSMVTLFHLHRYLGFVQELAAGRPDPLAVSRPVAEWFGEIRAVLDAHAPMVDGDRERRAILDALGRAGAAYRQRVSSGFDPTPSLLAPGDVEGWARVAMRHLEATIAAARRPDGLFHSYNLISFPTDDEAVVDHLGLMLEGQVAALASGALDPDDAVVVVEALFASDLLRADQGSFMLYPVRDLPPFLDRNLLPVDATARAPFLSSDRMREIVATDADGRLRFRSGLVNSAALVEALGRLAIDDAERAIVEDLYEEVFRHHSFTGRSSAMYGYEGIGSIYWHMVGKLAVAVAELHRDAIERDAPADLIARLAAAYRRIRDGLGFRKDPATFGAIPTDCYSHTPAGGGARQPGMTGQVKEEILMRLAELGIQVTAGRVGFDPGLLPLGEIVPAGEAASFTVCGVPIHLGSGDEDAATITYVGGRSERVRGRTLPAAVSSRVFSRDGTVEGIAITLAPGAPAESG
jgi:hypothetical protein